MTEWQIKRWDKVFRLHTSEEIRYLDEGEREREMEGPLQCVGC